MSDYWRDISSAPTEDNAEADLWVVIRSDNAAFRVTDAMLIDGAWCANEYLMDWAPVEDGRATITHWRPKPLPPITPSGA